MITMGEFIRHIWVNLNFYSLFQLSLADISIHVFTDFLQLKDKLDKFPGITACIKKVEENKNIAKWLKERPVTER